MTNMNIAQAGGGGSAEQAHAALPGGLEPPTSWLTAKRSSQLSYGRQWWTVADRQVGRGR